MTGFTKLFSTIVDSTVWREEMHVKVVWVTMLAKADRNGLVPVSLPGLADAARVSLEQCEDALARLSGPDRYSRTKLHEGRRIEEVDGGWRILNYLKYRELTSKEERRIKVREAVARHRRNRSVIEGNQCNHIAEAEAEAEAEAVPARRAAKRQRGDKVTWLTPYFDLWRDVAGEPPSGQLARYLKPIEAEIGATRAVLALDRWLRSGGAKFGIATFARDWKTWDAPTPGRANGGGLSKSEAVALDALESFNPEEVR